MSLNKQKILSIEPLGFPWKTQDPFLFCAYHRDEYPAGNEAMGVNKSDLQGRNIGQDFTIKDGWRIDAAGYLLILEGVPIEEPVVQHGPFVMNTAEEISETMQEFKRTQFGGWPWPEREVAHSRTKGRFALHADGTEESR